MLMHRIIIIADSASCYEGQHRTATKHLQYDVQRCVLPSSGDSDSLVVSGCQCSAKHVQRVTCLMYGVLWLRVLGSLCSLQV
jgi:hypothetical protein